MEIERKFWLKKTPPAHILGRGRVITQGYISLQPEIRLRQQEATHFLTIKGEGQMVRMEDEILITRDQFIALWPFTEGRRLQKTRHRFPYKTLRLELDIYDGHLKGLIILECEFPYIEAAHNFILPEWAGAAGAMEVTDDPKFKNKNLALLEYYPPDAKP